MAAKKKANSRAKANRLVSKYLSDMSKIEDACIDDGEEARMCMRAEKLADIIWKNALGYKELDVEANVETIHPPSLSYMKILLERMEGKVQDVSATKSKKNMADRVAATTKAKINDIAEES